MPTRDRTSLVELAIRCMDLTSLTGDETPADIGELCARALRPDRDDPAAPRVAAVCVYPRFVGLAAERLRATGVRVVAVAGGFPSGVASVQERVEEIAGVIEAGADEVDTVLDRMALGAAEGEGAVWDPLLSWREPSRGATMKVILETGALDSPELIREAGELAIRAGADFLKTSTGKIGLGASPGAVRELLRIVRDARHDDGRRVGVKVAGGIGKVDEAIAYIHIAQDEFGTEWPAPERFRIGASSLLDALVAARRGA
jgi:deoxyribose-phosphate aldolase